MTNLIRAIEDAIESRRMMPPRRQIHLSEAMLCVNCDTIFDQTEGRSCPACTSRQAVPAERYLRGAA